MSNFKSLREYFSENNLFIVPYYQRGYKWSLQKNENRGNLHLSLLLSDLKKEFANAIQEKEVIIPTYEYYLQGITVKEDEAQNSVELVDGQQRTTSLFILFCVLQNKGISLPFSLENKLRYAIRKSADEVLQGFIKGICEGDENIQDIAALKKAWKICEEEIKDIDNLTLFASFLLEHIKIIYIKLDANQDETKVFSMMNKDKAIMSQTDLIKSNILREASRQLFKEGQISDGLEWQVNQLRTKFATEWDNWRKWWENEQHYAFANMISLFKTKNEYNMSVLFALYQYEISANDKSDDAKKENVNSLFEYFKDKIADKDEQRIEAIEVFDSLRLLQNIIEEWYNDAEIYNYLGLLFKGCGLPHKGDTLKSLLKSYKEDKQGFVNLIKDKYRKTILSDSTKEQFIEAILSDENAYFSQYANIARQLLRMNVMMANNQKHKFDFSFYEEESYDSEEKINNASRRSLEHIKPQTPMNEEGVEQNERLESKTNTIGNLVLIPKGLNSMLSNRPFLEKKRIVFQEMLKEGNKYGLWFHTLSVFGQYSEWQLNEIEANRKVFENSFNHFFNQK